MKMGKRALSIFLVALMLFITVPIAFCTGWSHSGYCGGEGDGTNLIYTMEGNTENYDVILTISGSGLMKDYNLSDVRSPFGAGPSTTLIINDGVTSIGNRAFSNLIKLKTVSLSNSVKSIGDFAFSNNWSLNSVNIPNGVSRIGEQAFGGCSSLNTVTLSTGVSEIAPHAFVGCDKLTNVYYGGSKEQWNLISIGPDNDCLTNANIHYNSTGPGTGTDNPDFPDKPDSYEIRIKNVDSYKASGEILQSVVIDGKTYNYENPRRFTRPLEEYVNSPFVYCIANGKITWAMPIEYYADHGIQDRSGVWVEISATPCSYENGQFNSKKASVAITVNNSMKIYWASNAGNSFYESELFYNTVIKKIQDSGLMDINLTEIDCKTTENYYNFSGSEEMKIPYSRSLPFGASITKTVQLDLNESCSAELLCNRCLIDCLIVHVKGTDVSGPFSIKESTEVMVVNNDFNTPTTPHFPAGYSFDKDSLSFENDLVDVEIPQKYWDGIFEAGTASLAHSKHPRAGALCYGMAFTTASIYNGFPAISQWAYRTSLWSSEIATKIRDLKRDTWWGKQSAVYMGESNYLTLLDFIKYSHIYQWSVEAMEKLNNSSNNALDLLSIVKEYTDSGQMGVAVRMCKIKGHDTAPGSHEVLAIGYEGNEILIDNPNNADHYERMTVYENGGWKLGKYNSNDHWLSWDLAIDQPYKILLSGNKVVADCDNDDSTNENYVLGTQKINSDYNLVCINSSEYDIKNTDYIEIPENAKTDGNSKSNDTMFWVKEGLLKIENLNDGVNTITCAGDNSVISTTSCAGSSVSINVQSERMVINTSAGKKAKVSFKTVVEGETEDFEKCVEIGGISQTDDVSAIKTNTGIDVTGLNNMKITYSENDEVVSETTVNVSDGRKVYITIDKNTHSIIASHQPHIHSVFFTHITTAPTCITEGVRTNYCEICGEMYTEPIPATGNHADANNDGKCDTCKQKMTGGKHCKYCGKIHGGAFGWLTKFFHSILAIFKR